MLTPRRPNMSTSPAPPLAGLFGDIIEENRPTARRRARSLGRRATRSLVNRLCTVPHRWAEQRWRQKQKQGQSPSVAAAAVDRLNADRMAASVQRLSQARKPHAGSTSPPPSRSFSPSAAAPDTISKEREQALADRLSRYSPQRSPVGRRKTDEAVEPTRSAQDQQERMEMLLKDVPRHRRSTVQTAPAASLYTSHMFLTQQKPSAPKGSRVK
jgi:hypothetical protein